MCRTVLVGVPTAVVLVFHEIKLFCNLLILSKLWASFHVLSLLNFIDGCVILDCIDISWFV